MQSLLSYLVQSSQQKGQDDRRNDFLDGIVKLSYHERLTRFLRGSTRHWVTGGRTVVDFRPLYTVNLHHLQRQLAQEIEKMETEELTDSQLQAIRDKLHQYTNALRDFEFIHSNRWNTNFVKNIAASRINTGPRSKFQEALITDLGLNVCQTHRSFYRDSDLLGSFDADLLERSTALGRSLGTEHARNFAREERQAQFVLAWKRFLFAITGGLVIVIPMLLITVGHTTTKVLAVIPTSIFIFAACVAFFSKTDPVNLLAATAAYAAVLVTLIGPAVPPTNAD